MKLVYNWKAIALRSHSMLATYAGLACLAAPEIIFYCWGVDTSPRVWWIAGAALLLYGACGRLIDQGIDRSKTNSPWIVGIVALAVTLALVLGQLPGQDVQATAPPQSPVQQLAKADPPPAVPASSYDEQFLAIAVPFIGRWEGLRLEAYLDIVGVPTVCYGETKGVKLGDSYTKAECDAMFAREIISYRDRLRLAFSSDTLKHRMPVERDVAFTSFAYNVGVGGAGSSTAVRQLNAGKVAAGCRSLGNWNKAGGRVVRGLINRRADETALCLTGLA